MSRLLRGFIGIVLGYVIGAGVGLVLVGLLSQNTHDKSLELAMTAAFVTGPIGALIGLVTGLLVRKRT